MSRVFDFWEKQKGKEVEIYAKLLNEKTFFVYKGVFDAKIHDFVLLNNAEMIKYIDGKPAETSHIGKVAITIHIIALIIFK